MNKTREKEIRDQISQILVKWDMPTRQIAINEILDVLSTELDREREEIAEKVALYTIDLCENSADFKNYVLTLLAKREKGE